MTGPSRGTRISGHVGRHRLCSEGEPHPYTATEVRFRNGDATLAGSLYVPPGEGPFPVVVFLHGAGPEIRWGANRFFADHLARRGIAALIYDKARHGRIHR